MSSSECMVLWSALKCHHFRDSGKTPVAPLSVSMFSICPPVCLLSIRSPSHMCPQHDPLLMSTVIFSTCQSKELPHGQTQFSVLKASFPPQNSRLCMSSLEPHPPLCPSQILTCSVCVHSAVASLLLDCWAGVSACLIAGPGKLLKALRTCVLRSTA